MTWRAISARPYLEGINEDVLRDMFAAFKLRGPEVNAGGRPGKSLKMRADSVRPSLLPVSKGNSSNWRRCYRAFKLIKVTWMIPGLGCRCG